MRNNLLFLIFISFNSSVFANVSLPDFFADGMILQRNAEVKIWGWGNPKEEIVVTPSWNGKVYRTVTSRTAKWELRIPTPKEGGPYTINIKGYDEITLKDILIGEVWLCSGQSNMEMAVSWGIENGEEEAKMANYPNIRFFNIPKTSAAFPQNNLLGTWQKCTPDTMRYNSAIAYFFAKRLQQDLSNVPVGLIISAWGGTPAEVWIPADVIQKDEVLLQASQKLTPSEYGPIEPGSTFNAMINPLIGYNIAGVIWYQGESNVGSTVYDQTLATLISSWRELWKETFPFYYVQIAPFKSGENNFCGVEIRNAQRKVLQLPGTAMVVTSDISTIDDVHPKDKKSVGVRLANLALVNIYKTSSIIANGPLFKSKLIQKGKLTLFFDYAEGLKFKGNMNQFEIAGEDNIYYPAKAKIVKQTIELESVKVPSPQKVRFAWGNTVQSNLFNMADLPASSFTSE